MEQTGGPYRRILVEISMKMECLFQMSSMISLASLQNHVCHFSIKLIFLNQQRQNAIMQDYSCYKTTISLKKIDDFMDKARPSNRRPQVPCKGSISNSR